MNYRESVLKNVDGKLNNDAERLLLGALGLCGEAGETSEIIKKFHFHKKPIDRDKLIKELGDVRWYFELICACIGTTIQEVERVNMEKLAERYPTGFKREGESK